MKKPPKRDIHISTMSIFPKIFTIEKSLSLVMVITSNDKKIAKVKNKAETIKRVGKPMQKKESKNDSKNVKAANKM